MENRSHQSRRSNGRISGSTSRRRWIPCGGFRPCRNTSHADLRFSTPNHSLNGSERGLIEVFLRDTFYGFALRFRFGFLWHGVSLAWGHAGRKGHGFQTAPLPPVEIARLNSKFMILCNCVCCSCETFRFDLKGLRVTNS